MVLNREIIVSNAWNENRGTHDEIVRIERPVVTVPILTGCPVFSPSFDNCPTSRF